MLAAELAAGQLTTTQMAPEQSLGIGAFAP